MSLNVSKNRLATITRELNNQWQHTKEFWLDQKSQEFEREYMELLIGSVEKAVFIIEELDKITNHIRRDCE